MTTSSALNSRSLVAGVVALIATLGSHTAHAALVLPDVPLFVSVGVTPNVFFQVDDSGSMDFEVLAPDHFLSCSYDDQYGSCNGQRSDEVGATNWGRPNEPDADDRNGRWIYYHGVPGSRYENGTGGSCPGEGDGYNNGNDRVDMRRCYELGFDPIRDQDWRFASSDFNLMFFDLDNEYNAWAGYPDANFNSAHGFPVPESGTAGFNTQTDLSGFEFSVWAGRLDAGALSALSGFLGSYTGDRSFSGTQPDADTVNMVNTPNQQVDYWDDHLIIGITSAGASCDYVHFSKDIINDELVRNELPLSLLNCVALLGQAYDLSEVRQNVANWYRYNRRRGFIAQGAIVNVVSLEEDFRYGVNTIHNRLNVQVPSATTTNYGPHNSAMLTTFLSGYRPSGGTPLRNALERTGDYFENGSPDPITLSCQKNFTVAFTDGFWNGGNPGVGDEDGDGTNNTLADVAKRYYDRDLSGFDDNVPSDGFDTAAYQHMNTYTVAFGLEGALVDNDDNGWPDATPPLTESSSEWWGTGTNLERRVDDLWHAAYNGRGKFLSAKKPNEVTDALVLAIRDIAGRLGGAAAGAANTGSISSSSRLFQARFDAGDWRGELRAVPIDPVTNQPQDDPGDIIWEASEELDALTPSSRDIFSWDRSTGNGFEFTDSDANYSKLSTATQAALNTNPRTGVTDSLGKERLNYIRGDRFNEIDSGNGGNFRNRSTVLGDIVNSDPLYVSFPPFFYPFDNYQGFFNSNSARQDMVYVGANDGMLHAFSADTGVELFAYTPAAVGEKLNELTHELYLHEFYVDGAPVFGDAQIGGAWKTVLAAGMRHGAQGIYALDITDPTSFDASNVLWEFTDEDDVDVGYVYGEPSIRRMSNNKWAVIFGSGYNADEADGFASTTGGAALFIVYIDGTGYEKISVPSGNGLATPAAVDTNGDFKVDYVYAGDLNGDIYKFDVTGSPGSWNLAAEGNPLFNGSSDQPVTVRPAFRNHPLGTAEGGLLVFGTGKYLENTDRIDPDTQPGQSIHAVWDRFANVGTNGTGSDGNISISQLHDINLATQGATRIIDPATNTAVEWRDSDGNVQDFGYTIDLPVAGERVIEPGLVRDNLFFFVSMKPAVDPCSAGGSGWLTVIDVTTGLAPTFPVVDVNDDGNVDGNDLLPIPSPLPGGPNEMPGIGIEIPSIPNLPAVIYDDSATVGPTSYPADPINAPSNCSATRQAYFHQYITTSSGNLQYEITRANPLGCGRLNWRQVR